MCLKPILPRGGGGGGGGRFGTTLYVFCPKLKKGRKIIQPNLVAFPETIKELFESKSLNMDFLLLLATDRVLQNSNDVTVSSFLNQSRHNFLILLEILRCTFVPNLSKIGLFMFPWQHILETGKHVFTRLKNNVVTGASKNLVATALAWNQSLIASMYFHNK